MWHVSDGGLDSKHSEASADYLWQIWRRGRAAPVQRNWADRRVSSRDPIAAGKKT